MRFRLHGTMVTENKKRFRKQHQFSTRKKILCHSRNVKTISVKSDIANRLVEAARRLTR